MEDSRPSLLKLARGMEKVYAGLMEAHVGCIEEFGEHSEEYHALFKAGLAMNEASNRLADSVTIAMKNKGMI